MMGGRERRTEAQMRCVRAAVTGGVGTRSEGVESIGVRSAEGNGAVAVEA